ncbi:transposase [Planctomycetes bacterium Poly30]|uniref:transposase n=1 Tax=Saltatorellus ferox TaxID=2528018 RepID=UPI0011A79856
MSKEDPVTDPAKTDDQAQARMGRRSKVEPYKEKVLDWIKGEPGIQSIAIVERLREEGYDGGKSAVYDFVRKHRPPKQPDGIVRFESVPGEFAQHDFGQIVVEYQDGTRERIRFFASQLRYSRTVRVRVVPDETVETICYSVFEAYDYFGGMPLIGVFDNSRTIVTKRDGKKITCVGDCLNPEQSAGRHRWP